MIKRALFLGGAVLILAACADTTAPGATAREGGDQSSLRQAPSTPRIPTTMNAMAGGCRTGYWVISGNDSTWVGGDTSVTCGADF